LLQIAIRRIIRIARHNHLCDSVLFLFFFFTDLEDLNRCMDVTEDQIRTAKEIFPSLFINYGRVLPEVVIARCIFENNFDSGIVSRSLDRKVKMVMG